MRLNFFKPNLQETEDYLSKLENADSNLEKAKDAYKVAVENTKKLKHFLIKKLKT